MKNKSSARTGSDELFLCDKYWCQLKIPAGKTVFPLMMLNIVISLRC